MDKYDISVHARRHDVKLDIGQVVRLNSVRLKTDCTPVVPSIIPNIVACKQYLSSRHLLKTSKHNGG